jgi:hypothetical protein
MAYEKVFATKDYISKTIATDILTLDDWGICYLVDGEGSVADDLATINTGIEGQPIIIKADGVIITLKHGTGNIQLSGGSDYALAASSQVILFYDGTNWRDLVAPSGSLTAYVAKALFDAHSVLCATSDNTPAALTVTEQTVVGRLTGGNISAVALGIADNNIIQIDQADVADNDIAKFTANGLEGRSYTELKADLDLEIGTDVLAQQTIGIANDNLVEIDGADIADDEYARFTANGLESRTASEVFTDLLAQTILENDSLKLDAALSADGKYNGITEAGTAGTALAFGDVVYQAVADDRWELAQADAEATTKPRLGICVLAAAGDGEATNILLIGKIRADAVFPAFTKYAPVFLSPTTAGDLTNTAPSTAGQFIRCVGQAITATELWFNPDNMWWENV